MSNAGTCIPNYVVQYLHKCLDFPSLCYLQAAQPLPNCETSSAIFAACIVNFINSSLPRSKGDSTKVFATSWVLFHWETSTSVSLTPTPPVLRSSSSHSSTTVANCQKRPIEQIKCRRPLPILLKPRWRLLLRPLHRIRILRRTGVNGTRARLKALMSLVREVLGVGNKRLRGKDILCC